MKKLTIISAFTSAQLDAGWSLVRRTYIPLSNGQLQLVGEKLLPFSFPSHYWAVKAAFVWAQIEPHEIGEAVVVDDSMTDEESVMGLGMVQLHPETIGLKPNLN
jgi:hypothetical protein